MKKSLGSLPALFPMPVLMVAAYDENGKVNVMNAAWGTICDMDKIALIIDDDHKTTQNIRKVKAFTVSLADKAHMAEADFFGIASGNKINDKFERTGMHASQSTFVNAPIIDEFPIVMECELAEIVQTDHLFAVIGKILNVSAPSTSTIAIINDNALLLLDINDVSSFFPFYFTFLRFDIYSALLNFIY